MNLKIELPDLRQLEATLTAARSNLTAGVVDHRQTHFIPVDGGAVQIVTEGENVKLSAKVGKGRLRSLGEIPLKELRNRIGRYVDRDQAAIVTDLEDLIIQENDKENEQD